MKKLLLTLASVGFIAIGSVSLAAGANASVHANAIQDCVSYELPVGPSGYEDNDEDNDWCGTTTSTEYVTTTSEQPTSSTTEEPTTTTSTTGFDICDFIWIPELCDIEQPTTTTTELVTTTTTEAVRPPITIVTTTVAPTTTTTAPPLTVPETAPTSTVAPTTTVAVLTLAHTGAPEHTNFLIYLGVGLAFLGALGLFFARKLGKLVS